VPHRPGLTEQHDPTSTTRQYDPDPPDPSNPDPPTREETRMRHTPRYLMTDVDEVKRLIRANPWTTYVSAASTGLVASHYPTLLEETDDDSIVIVTHFGRPDEVAHEVGQHEMLVIVQGPHGYISPNWYEPGDIIPTWNHATAHLYGVPEILTEEQNYAVLERLTDHFEHPMPAPRSLASDEEYSRRIAKGTIGCASG
jgi:transcriptional regulator